MNRKLTAKGEGNMGLTRIQVTLKRPGSLAPTFTSDFLVDTGAIDSMAPASELRAIGIRAIGERAYELADGTEENYEYGLVEIKFMDEITAGRVIFGPEDVEPILGVTALESAGLSVDPSRETLRRMPTIPLK